MPSAFGNMNVLCRILMLCLRFYSWKNKLGESWLCALKYQTNACIEGSLMPSYDSSIGLLSFTRQLTNTSKAPSSAISPMKRARKEHGGAIERDYDRVWHSAPLNTYSDQVCSINKLFSSSALGYGHKGECWGCTPESLCCGQSLLG